jgi:hypothetical protein
MPHPQIAREGKSQCATELLSLSEETDCVLTEFDLKEHKRQALRCPHGHFGQFVSYPQVLFNKFSVWLA